MNTFSSLYPLSVKLGLTVVDAGPGYDELELQSALGPERFAKLMQGVKEVFSCNHAKYPNSHELAGYEVHCIYVRDLEKFLEQEAK